MDILKLCTEIGVTKAVEIKVSALVPEAGLHFYCEQNYCGRFGKNYTCPPSIGHIDDLIRQVESYDTAVIWQNVYALEDSFDFEGMADGAEKHNAITQKLAKQIYNALGRENVLVLTAGGCSICTPCAIVTDEPCRNPLEALSSLEAYGINVTQLCEASGLSYMGGANTVTYFGGAFIK